MEKPTLWNKIKRPFRDFYAKVEYYFAKKWLDRTFGEQEYWGEYISDLLTQQKGKNLTN